MGFGSALIKLLPRDTCSQIVAYGRASQAPVEGI